MTTRTDVHAPRRLVTEDYEFVIAYDSKEESLWKLLPADMAGRITRSLVHINPGCDHCGANIRYVAILRHRPTGDCIEVGEQCLDNRFGRATAEFQRLRKAARLDRERISNAQRAQQCLAGFGEDILTGEARQFLADRKADDRDVHPIASDIRSKLYQYGSISERQAALVQKLFVQDAERKTREAEDAANAKPVPTGTVELTGQVVSVKTQDGPYGVTTKCLVRGDGWRVWGTVPAAIISEVVNRGSHADGYGKVSDLTGRTLRLTATVTASDDDASFGFYKRPRNAQLLAEAGAH